MKQFKYKMLCSVLGSWQIPRLRNYVFLVFLICYSLSLSYIVIEVKHILPVNTSDFLKILWFHASCFAYFTRYFHCFMGLDPRTTYFWFCKILDNSYILGRDLVSGEAADEFTPPAPLPWFKCPSTCGLSWEPVRHNSACVAFRGEVLPVTTLAPPVSAEPARFNCVPLGFACAGMAPSILVTMPPTPAVMDLKTFLDTW